MYNSFVNLLKNRKNVKKDTSGFTLMEMVIAIPLIALTGGFVLAIIGSSITTINNNGNLSQAASEAQLTVKTFKESRNCYQLETKVTENEEREVEVKSGRTFKIVVPEIECESGMANHITVQAVQDTASGTPKVIYQTSTAVYISE